jgi:hypothetical protein
MGLAVNRNRKSPIAPSLVTNRDGRASGSPSSHTGSTTEFDDVVRTSPISIRTSLTNPLKADIPERKSSGTE